MKEPQPEVWRRLRPGQILLAHLHLAPDPAQAEGLTASACTAIACDTAVRMFRLGGDLRRRGAA